MNEFLPFSMFSWCHRYTSVKTTVYYINIGGCIIIVFPGLLE